MPSPVLHTAAGLALYCIDRPLPTFYRWRVAGLIVFAALLPDIDFLVGLLMGGPNRFHGGLTHSLGGAVGCGIVLGMLAVGRRFRVGLLCFLAYASHVVLDSLTRDARPPVGVPMLWPLTDRYFNLPLIAGIWHGSERASLGRFLREVLSVTNLRTLGVEAGIGSLLLVTSLGVRRIRGRRPSCSRSAESRGNA